jgi:mutator protein MutT
MSLTEHKKSGTRTGTRTRTRLKGRESHSRSGKSRSDDRTTIIDVAAGLVFRGGKLLITKRFPNAHLGGLWEFPGGKREPNESFKACLVRELAEELGIEVTVGALIEAVTHDYKDKHVHLRFFRCEWKAREARPLGCEACRWVTRQDLKKFEFPAADAFLLRRLQQDGSLWEP